MAVTSKALFRGAASTSSTTLYTVPSATTTIATNIVVTNTSSSDASFTMTFNAIDIAKSVTVGGFDSTIIDMKQVLAATNIIAGTATTTSVNFHISGVEIA